MSARVMSIVSCFWLAAAAATAPSPAATAPSPARESLEASWGSRLLHAVVIADVAPGSPAEKAGVRIGDVLESYDRTGLDDVAGFDEFEAHVLTLRNKEGNVRVTVGRWRPAAAGTEPKIELQGMRELVLPVPSP